MLTHTYELASYTEAYGPRPYKPTRHRCIDFGTTFILFAVWGFLFLIGVVLLGFASHYSSANSELGRIVTADEVGNTIALSSLPVLAAAVLNEILVDRAWRRIVYYALGRDTTTFDHAKLAYNLRAANLSLWIFIKRFFQSKLTKREYRTAFSYVLIRWGTTLSIASAQLAVGWKPSKGGYIADKRHIILILPFVIHCASIFGAVCIWRWPWAFFSDRSNDYGLWRKYQPYLDAVDGSLASFEQVAKVLEDAARGSSWTQRPTTAMMQPTAMRPAKLTVRTNVRSGRQIIAKLNGLAFGLVMMFVPPAVAWAFVTTPHTLSIREYRFAFTFVFLSQNVFYVQALDFAIWNISLDGFCWTPKARSNTSMRHLGYSAGPMVLTRACCQRRPVRAAWFLWFFWLQACGMRFLSTLYSLCVTMLSYYSLSDMSGVLNPRFWLGWMVLTVAFTLPLFLVWMFKKVDAPVCAVDGWRWAQIAQGALREGGYYGIKNGRAAWAQDVEPFHNHLKEPVI